MRVPLVWVAILAACGGVTLAALMRAKRESPKQMHEAELQQWENEGGSPALSSQPKHSAYPATVELASAGPTSQS